jgi:hypothetical protein
MVQVVTQDIRLTTGQALDVPTEKILSPDGPTPTQRQSRHVRWVLVHDTQRLTDIGVGGIGGRLLGLVFFFTLSGFTP